eukprot:3545838-Pyramimonas_sp.AAC.1
MRRMACNILGAKYGVHVCASATNGVTSNAQFEDVHSPARAIISPTRNLDYKTHADAIAMSVWCWL